MENVTIKVGGMSCEGCVKNVTGALSALDGVAGVAVSLEAGEEKVDFYPARVTPASLTEAGRCRRREGELLHRALDPAAALHRLPRREAHLRGLAQAPKGVMLETPEQIAAHAVMSAQTVASGYMPLGNLTEITDDEREQIAIWFAQGARTAD